MTLATWLYVAAAVALDGCAALAGAAVPERWLERARAPLIGFAAGVLLATTFLDVLPEALAHAPAVRVLGTVLGSVVVMVLLEWTVGHRVRGGSDARRLSIVLLGADAFHNVADGGAIGAAFAISPRLGVITSIAVIAHEVPEEVADYVVLRRAGMSRARAVGAMAGVQLTAAIGAVLALLGVAASRSVSSVVLAVAAGTFLHIAEVDLVPTIVEGHDRRRRLEGLGGLIVGVTLVVAESL